MIFKESREEILHKMRNLPSDWWQSVNSADAFIQLFQRNVVGLLLAGMIDAKFQYSIYTGFLLWHEENLLWLTAGHIVEEIVSILSSNEKYNRY